MDIKEVKRLQKEAAKRRAKEKKEKELGEFASYEELYFSWYLDDLIKHGYVSKYELQPPAHVIFPRITIAWMEEMKTKLKINEHPVLQEGHRRHPGNSAVTELFFRIDVGQSR